MKDASKHPLQEMFTELLNGVEYKKLGDLGTFENIGVDKKTIEGQPLVSLLNYVDVYKNIHIDNNVPQMIVSATTKKIKDCTCEKGDIFITPTSETRDDIGHASVVTETLVNTVYSYHIMRFRLAETNNMTTSFFIRYLFESELVQKQIYKLAKGLTRFGLSKYDFAKIEIPLPPLPVQEEIVRILDNFTNLAAELQAELQARRKQYEYYRDTLLSFEGRTDVQWMKLDDVSTHYTGLTYKPTDVSKTNQGTLVLRSSNIKNERVCFEDNVFVELDSIPDRAIAKPGDILICVRNGSKQLIGKAALIPETPKPMAFGAFMTVLRANSINNKFLFYLWQSFVVKKQLGTDDAMPINQITNREFSKISVPVPPLSEQQRIVDTLDRFDTLTNDLSQGLPAEIEARQQQYEYYRDRLLRFKRM